MKKNLFFIVAVIFSAYCLNAQESRPFKTNVMIGLPVVILPTPDHAIHLSANEVYFFNQYIGAEGQVSWSRAKFDRQGKGFFKHDGGQISNFNVLTGFRAYALPEKYWVRPGISALGGFGWGINSEYDYNESLQKKHYGPLSYKVMGLLEIEKRVVLGAGVEGPYDMLVFCAGVQF